MSDNINLGDVLKKADQVLDYIPGLSSLSNGIDLLLQATIIPKYFPSEKQGEAHPSSYIRHVKNKNALRCCIGLIPVLGNASLGIADMIKSAAAYVSTKRKETGIKLEQEAKKEVNAKKSLRKFEKAADKGNLDAILYLIDFYYKIEGQEDKYLKRLRQGAGLQNARCLRDLGAVYAQGTHGIKKDLSKAETYYKRAARDLNDSEAQYELARFYLSSSSLSYKTAETLALDWFAAAAEQGFAPAQYELGRYYEKGGFDQKGEALLSEKKIDLEKALELYQKAAYQEESQPHYAPALYALGKIYKEGKGTKIKPDDSKALNYFAQAASQANKNREDENNQGVLKEIKKISDDLRSMAQTDEDRKTTDLMKSLVAKLDDLE